MDCLYAAYNTVATVTDSVVAAVTDSAVADVPDSAVAADRIYTADKCCCCC